MRSRPARFGGGLAGGLDAGFGGGFDSITPPHVLGMSDWL
jgi:hypothetical protein